MSDEGHIHIYVPDLEQPDHGRCGCGRDGTPTTYDWWKTAITQAAALAEARKDQECVAEWWREATARNETLTDLLGRASEAAGGYADDFADLPERVAALAEARREIEALREMLLRAMEAEDPDEWHMDAQALIAALASKPDGETR